MSCDICQQAASGGLTSIAMKMLSVWRIKQLNNNEPDTLPDPAIGYIFQNDIVALKQAFSLPDIDYADISQREQLAAALKRWPLLAEFAQQK